ncbi:MAG: hypothetical protein Q8M37_00815 [Nevskia sp.]|nr:hypothetical protein [Nevskia sp.]
MTAPTHKQLLILQRMEMSLVRAVLAKPSFLVSREYKQLRYLLSFARLHVFAPGGVDGSARREDVELAQDLIAPLRERVLLDLNKSLSHERDPERRLAPVPMRCCVRCIRAWYRRDGNCCGAMKAASMKPSWMPKSAARRWSRSWAAAVAPAMSTSARRRA